MLPKCGKTMPLFGGPIPVRSHRSSRMNTSPANPNALTAQQYREAFQQIGGPSDAQLANVSARYYAPDRKITAREMAEESAIRTVRVPICSMAFSEACFANCSARSQAVNVCSYRRISFVHTPRATPNSCGRCESQHHRRCRSSVRHDNVA